MFKVNVSLLVEAKSPAHALEIASQVVKPIEGLPYDRVRISVDGDMFSSPMRTKKRLRPAREHDYA